MSNGYSKGKNYSVVRVESSDATQKERLSQESAESSPGAETQKTGANKKGLVIAHVDNVEGEEDVGRGIARRMEKVRRTCNPLIDKIACSTSGTDGTNCETIHRLEVVFSEGKLRRYVCAQDLPLHVYMPPDMSFSIAMTEGIKNVTRLELSSPPSQMVPS